MTPFRGPVCRIFSPNKEFNTADFPRLTKPKAAILMTLASNLFSVAFMASISGFSKLANSGFAAICPDLRRYPYQDNACLRLARARFK